MSTVSRLVRSGRRSTWWTSPAGEAGKHGADTPMKRPAQPDEIAPAFVFFASEGDSSYITGEVLTPLGGKTTAE